MEGLNEAVESENVIKETTSEIEIMEVDNPNPEVITIDTENSVNDNDVKPTPIPNEEAPVEVLGNFTAESSTEGATECYEEQTCEIIEETVTVQPKIETQAEAVSQSVSDKFLQLQDLIKNENTETIDLCEDKSSSTSQVKKIQNMPDSFTDSSQSLSSEQQSSAAPFESSCSSLENNMNANRVDFENAIERQILWKEATNSINETTPEVKLCEESIISAPVETTETITPANDVIEISEIKTEPSAVPVDVSSDNANTFVVPAFPLSAPTGVPSEGTEIKVETGNQLPEPPPAPVIPPAPRKRGRPRKQVLPNPSPLVESWGPNAQEFPVIVPPKEERKRPPRPERRQAKKKKLEDEEDEEENLTRKKKATPIVPKKKRRSTYVPKKKVPPIKKKHSEIENFQNFEEETRMSATEAPTNFSSKSGAMGDESQGSSATDGHTRSNINKKGRMEVGSDGCKPVTVQQIVEYYWPPPSSLPHGEKPEALMIQEQICEYLGVKSFKRKYPSIKRRPVDMEERNYLQENGYVSENMCDMGITAVFAADIIEIMYNDFPHKFEEYRKYTREKKAKEQRALREKQAAERADMDPKKEAIESTISWNSDFNKTRRFKVLHRNRTLWSYLDGMPCPNFEKVLIIHASDNRALCVEDEYWSLSLFSYECEISTHNRIDKSNKYLDQNLWIFSIAIFK